MTKEEQIEQCRAAFKKEIRKLEQESLAINIPEKDDPSWIFLGIECDGLQRIIQSHSWFIDQMSKAYFENITESGMFGVCLSIKKMNEYDDSDERHSNLVKADKKSKEIIKKYKEQERLIMEEPEGMIN